MDWVPLLLVALPPTIAAVGALALSWVNGRKLNAIHVDINSRLTELLLERGRAERSEGKAEGIAEQKLVP